jgi:O-antigen ligase
MNGGLRASRRGRWGALDREDLDAICEKGILGSVLAILVFAPLATGATSRGQFLTLLGFSVVISCFWIVRTWVRQQYRVLAAPFCWIVGVFTAYTNYLYTRADIEYYARIELLQVLLYAFLFFAILDNLTRQESVQLLLFTLIGVGVVEAFYAIFQYFTGSNHVLWYIKPLIYKGRGSGTYICPNHLAGFLEMLLPVALACTITGRFKHITKIFLGYAAVMMLAGIGVTISRGGYLAMGASLVVFFFVLLWKRDFRLPALAFLILLLGTGSFFGYRSIRSQVRFTDLQNSESSVRGLYWSPAYEMWQKNFWTGVGPNHYDWRFRAWRNPMTQVRPVYAHNDYLNTLADYGTIGGIIIGSGLLLLGWSVFRIWKYVQRSNEIASKPSNRAAVVLGTSVGLLAIVFHSVVDFNMHIPANAITAVVLMAILTSHLRFATERFWVKPGIVGKTFGTLLIVGFAVYSTWQIGRLGAEAYYASRSERPLRDAERLALLRKANEVEPNNPDVVTLIGEIIRRRAWNGDDGYQDLLRAALPWFQRGMVLNRWDPYNYAFAGMCYTWLGEKEKAADMFEIGRALDPYSYYMISLYGWHLVEEGKWLPAWRQFLRSYGWMSEGNEFAKNYLDLLNRRLAEQRQKQVHSGQ